MAHRSRSGSTAARPLRLINAIKPGSIRKILTSPMPFKQMANINAYSEPCKW